MCGEGYSCVFDSERLFCFECIESLQGYRIGRSLLRHFSGGKRASQTAGTKMSICTLDQKQLKSGKASRVLEKLSAQVQREKI